MNKCPYCGKILSEDERILYKCTSCNKRIEDLTLKNNHPLYDDIHQIAGDIRFLKNLVILGILLGVAFTIIGMFLL